MELLIKAPRGTEDNLPFGIYRWQFLQDIIFKVCSTFGFTEIRTPIFEHTELFQRGVGDFSDVVQKEMYTFLDKSDRSLTLRPEGTSSVVRSVLQNGLINNNVLPIKVFYFGPFFRYEKPQSGRLRQFHQFGVEMFGSCSYYAEVQIILLVLDIFNILKIKNIKLKLNSIGCDDCRPNYVSKLRDFLTPYRDSFCNLCKIRMDTNVLRVIDCKNENCQSLLKLMPNILEYLCNDCDDHFKNLIGRLDILGIHYEIDVNIVRGLDYYNKTVFEFVYNDDEISFTVCGGGRYDNLIEQLGGNSVPAIGFGLGIERLLYLIDKQNINIKKSDRCDVYIVNIGNNCMDKVLCLFQTLTNEGIKCEFNLMDRSFKSQMKYANKINATTVLILGDDELQSNTGKLKFMKTGEQIDILLDDSISKNLYNMIVDSIYNNE